MGGWVVPFRFINPFTIQNVLGMDESCHIALLWGRQSQRDREVSTMALELCSMQNFQS